MYQSILTGCLRGVEADVIHAEVDVSTGLPGLSMVGSLSTEAKEARERVIVAMKNATLHTPEHKQAEQKYTAARKAKDKASVIFAS